MAGLIPRNFIDDLLARTDVVEVIEGYVKLSNAGRNYKACCPFHHEKSPSFTVSREKQFYHCFGCGAHGSAISFLMEYAGLDFIEAVEQLSGRLGLDVPREGGSEPRADYTELLGLLDDANNWFQQQLRQHSARQKAVDYLKGRGLSGQIANRFQMGFAPSQRDALVKALAKDDVHLCGQLVTAGLATERAPGQFTDKFRNRVMFPIHNRRGQVVGFGGRVLDDGQPKYLNSPETPVFHKGRELYGLWQARKANRKLEEVIVVEGYMDVVALAQHDITQCVASLGTAATGEHVEKLFQNTNHIVFCFDGDRAGLQAAWRALENSLPHMRGGRQIGFIFLPEGEDPDTLVRAAGADAIRERVRTATPLSDYLFQELSLAHPPETMEGRSALAEAAKPLLAKLPPGVFHELALQRLGELTRLAVERLGLEQLAPPAGRSARDTLGSGTQRRPAKTTRQKAPTPSLMRRILTLLLHHPSLAQGIEFRPELNKLSQPGADLLREALDLAASRPDLTTGGLLEHFRDHAHGKHLTQLASGPAPLIEAGLELEFSDALKKLLQLSAEERFRTLTERARQSVLTSAEKDEYQQLLAGQKI